MQNAVALRLKERWGGKPCAHPKLTKEYDRGTATGDYVCTTCGESGWGCSWNKKSEPTVAKKEA